MQKALPTDHNFLTLKKPSPWHPAASPPNVIDILALAGKAIKSNRVRPVTLPEECLPKEVTRFSLPLSVTYL